MPRYRASTATVQQIERVVGEINTILNSRCNMIAEYFTLWGCKAPWIPDRTSKLLWLNLSPQTLLEQRIF